MKTLTFLSILWGLNLYSVQAFSNDHAGMVQAEFSKTKSDFQANFNQLKKSLRDLEMQKSRAVREAKAQAVKDQEGIKNFKTYDVLVSSRYVDKDGKYQSSLEVSQKDHENLNQLFQTYLKANPLSGKLSAGHARRYIAWAMDRLKELSQYNAEPSEENNPELEILARMSSEAESRLATVVELAGRLGVKLDEASALAEMGKDPIQNSDRVPASVK